MRTRPAKFILLIALSFLPLSAMAVSPLVYAPLPLQNLSITQASNQPLADLLSELLGQPVEMRLYESHGDLLDALARGDIDFTTLGSLPLLLALENDPSLVQLVMLREPSGQATYRCVLAAPVDGVQSLDQLKDADGKMTLALTREESTCGPVASYSILIDHGLSPLRFSSSYQGGHDDVAKAVLLQSHLIGGLKESVAAQWVGLGLRTLATSRQIPGIVLLARAESLTSAQADRLRAAMLQLERSQLDQLQTGQFGFADIDQSLQLRVRAMRREAQPYIDQHLR